MWAHELDPKDTGMRLVIGLNQEPVEEARIVAASKAARFAEIPSANNANGEISKELASQGPGAASVQY